MLVIAWMQSFVFDLVVGAGIARDIVRLGIPRLVRTAAIVLTFLAVPAAFLVLILGRGALWQKVSAESRAQHTCQAVWACLCVRAPANGHDSGAVSPPRYALSSSLDR